MSTCRTAIVASAAAVLLVAACTREGDAAKREAERLRAELDAMKAAKTHEDAAKARAEVERLKAELVAAKGAKGGGPLKGKKIIDEFLELGEGQQLQWKMTSGRYRVRATSSDKGVNIKWVGAECAASSKEVTVYDETCEVSSEAQLLVENPSRFRRGPSEQLSLTVTAM